VSSSWLRAPIPKCATRSVIVRADNLKSGRPKENPATTTVWRGSARSPATTFAKWRGLLKLISGLSEAPISSRHVPVDAGHGNCLGAHHGIVDNVIDDVRTRRSDILMHQDIAGAVAVEIADATHADV
jgi:hypothetical protein